MTKLQTTWANVCIVSAEIARLTYRVIEGGTILALFVTAFYAGYWLVWGSPADPRYSRMLNLLDALSRNWKAFFLLAIPLFYRTVRTFLEEVQEAGGIKRRTTPAAPIPPQGENPKKPSAS